LTKLGISERQLLHVHFIFLHMSRTLTLAALLVLALDCGHCQDVVKTVAFEAASIKPCKPGTPAPPGTGPPMVKWIYPGGRFNANAATLQFLLEWAYGIIPEQHSGGPAWMENERYDIVAKAAGNATDQEMKLMVRTLLTDEFKLKLHIERREMSVLAVSLGKSEPKLFPAKEGEMHSLKITPQMGPDPKTGSYHVVATRFSLEDLNESFARQLRRVIVDQTGIKGDLDFALDFPFDDERPNPLDPSNVISAMLEQLGLTVKSQKGMADFFVIESAERVLVGN
jgi:uncharacterized protein (TIGR03435 family)